MSVLKTFSMWLNFLRKFIIFFCLDELESGDAGGFLRCVLKLWWLKNFVVLHMYGHQKLFCSFLAFNRPQICLDLGIGPKYLVENIFSEQAHFIYH